MFNAALLRRAGSVRTTTNTTNPLFLRFIASTPRARTHSQFTNATASSSLLRRQVQLPTRLLRHDATTALIQTRSMSFSQRMKFGLREASKGIWRKNPILLPLAIVSVVGATLIFAYIAYVEVTRVGPQYHKFPPPVAESLRTAVYYTEVDLNPPRALKAYKEALRMAIEMGMHPFSDEVLGIKLQVAMMLEKSGLVKPAIEVLERTKTETLAWVEAGRKQAAERRREEGKKNKMVMTDIPPQEGQQNITEGGHEEHISAQQKLEINDPEVLETYQKMKEIEEYEDRQRDKAMKKAVGIEMKLAELYSSDYIQDSEKAEAAQVAAVELSLKELKLRESLGLPVGGGDNDSSAWLNRTEIAAALAELAATYNAQDKQDLSLPLYFRALDLLRIEEAGRPSCRQVELLNGVASAMGARAQQPMRGEDPQAMRNQALDAAREWALKSLDISAKVSDSDWDDLCDISCVAARYNLGEFAETQGKMKEAEKWYKEAQSLAKKLEYGLGIELTSEALARVTKK